MKRNLGTHCPVICMNAYRIRNASAASYDEDESILDHYYELDWYTKNTNRPSTNSTLPEYYVFKERSEIKMKKITLN